MNTSLPLGAKARNEEIRRSIVDVRKTTLLLILFSFGLLAESPFNSERKFLKRLGDFEKRREDLDPLPHLVVSSAQAYKTSQEALYKIVKANLLKGKREIRSIQKKEELVLPDAAVTGSELEGIRECNQSYCAIKLLNATEKNRIEVAQDKIGLFQQFLFERLIAYIKLGELRGSEDVVSNLETLRAGFSQMEFVKSLYPKTYELIVDSILKQKKLVKAKPFVDSFLNVETIQLDRDKAKPVLRLSEIFEFEEAGTNLFFDLHIYTNHFCDSSLRLIEVQRHEYKGMPSRLIVTDVMEVDELKKSGLIRALFKGRMIGGIQFYQDALLDRVKADAELAK